MNSLLVIGLSFLPVIIYTIIKMKRRKEGLILTTGLSISITILMATLFTHFFLLNEILLMVIVSVLLFLVSLNFIADNHKRDFILVRISIEVYNNFIVYIITGGTFIVGYKLFYGLENIVKYPLADEISLPLLASCILFGMINVIRFICSRFDFYRYNPKLFIGVIILLVIPMFVSPSILDDDYDTNQRNPSVSEYYGYKQLDSYVIKDIVLTESENYSSVYVDEIFVTDEKVYTAVRFKDSTIEGGDIGYKIIQFNKNTYDIEAEYQASNFSNFEGYYGKLYYASGTSFYTLDNVEIVMKGRLVKSEYSDGLLEVTRVDYNNNETYIYQINTISDEIISEQVVEGYTSLYKLELKDIDGNILASVYESSILYETEELKYLNYNNKLYVFEDFMLSQVGEMYDSKVVVPSEFGLMVTNTYGTYILNEEKEIISYIRLYETNSSKIFINDGVISYFSVEGQSYSGIHLQINIVDESTLDLNYHYFITLRATIILLAAFLPLKKENAVSI